MYIVRFVSGPMVKWYHASFVHPPTFLGAHSKMVLRVVRPDLLILKMFFTYIIRSEKNNSYYVGSCKDIRKRALSHNKGRVPSTKRYLPWHIIYTEQFETLTLARKRESQIKSWKSRSAIENLIKHFKN